jgi:uncharacterized damage-inducible protein DinB
MKRVAATFLALSVCGFSVAQAQEKASTARAGTEGISAIYSMAKSFLVKAAEQIPEDKYSFQPTKDVRTVGSLFSHIADANNFFCSQVTATPKQYSDKTEKTAKTKAEIVAALNASFTACDAAYAGVGDADLSKPITVFGQPRNVAAVLTMNAAHDMEHYGNIVTYMRILNMVPPSSQN